MRLVQEPRVWDESGFGMPGGDPSPRQAFQGSLSLPLLPLQRRRLEAAPLCRRPLKAGTHDRLTNVYHSTGSSLLHNFAYPVTFRCIHLHLRD